jgi:hypothetical protein
MVMLSAPLRSPHLGFVSGRFQIVLRPLEMRLWHRGVLVEGRLAFPSGGLEMVLGLSEMRVIVDPGCLGVVFHLV